MYSTAVQRNNAPLFNHESVAALREMPPFNQTVRDTLNDFWLTCVNSPNPSPPIKALGDNLLQTLRLWNDLEGCGGQKHIGLLQFKERIDYFCAALQAIDQGLPLPPDKLGLFSEDKNGNPLSWHTLHQERTARLESSPAHVALMTASALFAEYERCPNSASLERALEATKDLYNFGRLLDIYDVNDLPRHLNAAPEFMKDTLALLTYSMLPEEARLPEIARRVSFRLYSQDTILPDQELWSSVNQIAQHWVKPSVKYKEGYSHPFDEQDLKDCVEKYRGSLIVLALDNKPAYISLLYSDPNVIPPVTEEKISAAIAAGRISSHRRDCWAFLVARDEIESRALHRLVHTDWYAPLYAAMGDVVIANGGERVVGRVLQSNTSAKPHQRMGAVETGAIYVDEHGEMNNIIASDLLRY